MSSCSRNDLCASSPLKSRGSLQQLRIFLCMKSHSSTKYKSAAISVTCTCICTSTRVQTSIVRRLHQSPRFCQPSRCRLSSLPAFSSSVPNYNPSRKLRPIAKPRQHIPYVNETPPPKLCRSGKEIVCATFASFKRNLSVLQVEAPRIPP